MRSVCSLKYDTDQSRPLLRTDALPRHHRRIFARDAASHLARLDLLIDERFRRCEKDDLARREPPIIWGK